MSINFDELLQSPEMISDREISSIASFLMELACAFESQYFEHLKRHDKNEIEHGKWLSDYVTSLNSNKDETDTF